MPANEGNPGIPPAKLHPLMLLLGIALLVRLLLFTLAVAEPARFHGGDTDEYVRLARMFPEAYGMAQPEIQRLSLKRPPLYPALLAAVFELGGGDRAAVLLQIALSLITLVLLYQLGLSLGGSVVAFWAGLFLVIEPASVLDSLLLLTETPFTLLLVAASLALVSGLQEGGWRAPAAAGFLLGLACLARPIGLLLPVVLVPLTWFRWPVRARRQRLAAVGALLVTFLALTGGWTAFNWFRAGVPAFSTIANRSLALYRGAGALAEAESIPIGEARSRIRARITALAEDRPLTPLREGQIYSQIGIETLLDHPVGAAVSNVKGLIRTLAGPSIAGYRKLLGAPAGEHPPRLLTTVVVATIILGLLYLLAVFGVISAFRTRPELFWLSIALAGYLLLIAAGPEAYSRFRTPAVPFLALLAGQGVRALQERYLSRSSRTIPKLEAQRNIAVLPRDS